MPVGVINNLISYCFYANLKLVRLLKGAVNIRGVLYSCNAGGNVGESTNEV